jgi:hypothetical protein
MMDAAALQVDDGPVWEPVTRDDFCFDVLDYAERTYAEHFGLPHDLIRSVLARLDSQWEERTGAICFEHHLTHAFGWTVVAEALSLSLRDDGGVDCSLAGPFTITVH